jgi:hypothetical protein
LKFFRRLFPLFFLVAACGPGDREVDTAAASSPFFDLKGYFTAEIERLQREQPPAEKTATFDEDTESRRLDSLDYAAELRLFLNADISRPAWRDKYVTDSTFHADGALARIAYAAIDPRLKVREVIIDWEEGQVARVRVHSYTKSFTAEIEQTLLYDPKEGYRIESRQNVALAKPRHLRVETRFSP